MHILITGAAGSGTSTLAAAFSDATPSRHLETDDYFWRPSDPPYRDKYDEAERCSALLKDLRTSPSAVVAGSLIAWGETLEDTFDLVVFLYLPTAIRVARLQLREERRFGKADPAFLAWAAQYDAGTAEGRSLARHRHWLKSRTCPVLCLEGELSTDDQLLRLLAARRSLISADRQGQASL
ncbi:AAA family ATPase [Polaromonas sp. SM01]|uniref:AAA family ATPase n=1 Tax=Polaromonas sp. SM01 TaxID=3085630 RepID=UPI002982A088|nr:AAA family ATPase [Polaromonas sp. SM01]MDW5443277.1 AAA family ATPase [Polaromonas sp. SM01]